MKRYQNWREDYGAAEPEAPPGAYNNTKIGPQNRISAKVRTASNRFDRGVGDSLIGLSLNQKLHFLADTIMGMTGEDEKNIGKDRQLLAKLRSLIIKIDSALKKHQSQQG
jgi:hypothetical protein